MDSVANEFGSLPWDRPKADPADGDLFTPERYTYLGMRDTAHELVGRRCDPVRRADGRCVVGRGSALVIFAGESVPRVVSRRRLRLNR